MNLEAKLEEARDPMAVDVTALRQNLELLLDRCPDLAKHFYDTLFARYPSVRPLFQQNFRNVQERMFLTALSSAVDLLADRGRLVESLSALGAKHAHFGVTDEMYDWFGDALLRTLSEATGPDWTPSLEENWAEAYATIAALMRSGEPDATRARTPSTT